MNPISEVTQAEHFRRKWVEEMARGARLEAEVRRLERLIHEARPHEHHDNHDATGFLEST